MDKLSNKCNVIDITKPVEIKSYLTVSVLGKSLSLNINYKDINVPKLDVEEKDSEKLSVPDGTGSMDRLRQAGT